MTTRDRSRTIVREAGRKMEGQGGQRAQEAEYSEKR